MIADLVAERAPIGAELSPRATPCIMLSLIPSSSFNLVAGLAPQPQMRSSVAMALDRPIKVAVIGGGPSGACAAEIFAKVHCCPANHRERGLRASLTSSGPPKTLHRVAVRLAGPPQPQSPAPGNLFASPHQAHSTPHPPDPKLGATGPQRRDHPLRAQD